MSKIDWMGEFIDPEIEHSFRKYEWNELRRRMMFASFAGALAYCLGLIGDYLMISSESMFREIAVIRISILIVGLMVSLLGYFLDKYSPVLNKAVCILLLLVLFGESAEIAIKSELIAYVGIPGSSVLVLLFYLSFPPRFKDVMAVCVIGCSTFLITCWVLGYASLEYIYTSFLMFLVVNCFGSYVYIQLSTVRRREYCALEELKKNAEIDGLTQVYNRRKVLELGDGEVELANNYNHDYSVIMIDVDNFKGVNDMYGHAVGDQVLAEVANRCSKVLRDVDIFGRYGGEEFVVYLPYTNLSTTLVVAERLRSAIADATFETSRIPLHMSISLGAATLSKEKQTPRKLLELADEALYTAKNTGKNKVCTVQNTIPS
ncbi:GGDEF domain-containing protein [Alginatibacterium sediminis]|uniref:diguanylate cyclase n=1 Tax=Alginatibacterium sediminis TaxID=2164068 RepID=A0A420EDG2_9ALTE|nr:GGDEF domain-containing protein [Alginatibacterium sediminis]RKF18711.1 GGDEF domain-containing protein [Alginatibacterium sediminis]